MPSVEGRRSSRRPRGTTRQSDVVDAALVVADQAGIDGLTIRAVARVAKVPTMSLYSHFASKAELLDLMYGELLLRLFVDEPHASWQAGVLATCARIREVLVAHPRWVPLLARSAPPLAVPWQERMRGLMVADGFSSDAALAAISSVVLVAEGLILLELSLAPPNPPNVTGRRAESRTVDQEASTGHPTSTPLMSAGPRFDPAQNFEVAVRTYVRGLENTPRPA
jgi:TetR/AcrR family tetracycline transcriptional repressor